jgi:hypothetical protein
MFQPISPGIFRVPLPGKFRVIYPPITGEKFRNIPLVHVFNTHDFYTSKYFTPKPFLIIEICLSLIAARRFIKGQSATCSLQFSWDYQAGISIPAVVKKFWSILPP